MASEPLSLADQSAKATLTLSSSCPIPLQTVDQQIKLTGYQGRACQRAKASTAKPSRSYIP